MSGLDIQGNAFRSSGITGLAPIDNLDGVRGVPIEKSTEPPDVGKRLMWSFGYELF